MKLTTQEKAFQFYYQMGDDRTLARVAEEFMSGKYSERTIKNWSSPNKGNWKERIKELDLRAYETLKQDTEELIKVKKVQIQRELLQVIMLMLSKYPESVLQSNKINAKDLDILVRLLMELQDTGVIEEEEEEASTSTTINDNEMLQALNNSIVQMINNAK